MNVRPHFLRCFVVVFCIAGCSMILDTKPKPVDAGDTEDEAGEPDAIEEDVIVETVEDVIVETDAEEDIDWNGCVDPPGESCEVFPQGGCPPDTKCSFMCSGGSWTRMCCPDGTIGESEDCTPGFPDECESDSFCYLAHMVCRAWCRLPGGCEVGTCIPNLLLPEHDGCPRDWPTSTGICLP